VVMPASDSRQQSKDRCTNTSWYKRNIKPTTQEVNKRLPEIKTVPTGKPRCTVPVAGTQKIKR